MRNEWNRKIVGPSYLVHYLALSYLAHSCVPRQRTSAVEVVS